MPAAILTSAHHNIPLWAWIGFFAFVVLMLALDLGVFQKKAHTPKMKESLGWCCMWVSLALIFNTIVWQTMGKQSGLEFLTGYLIELCLSVDNIFVFIVIFMFFKVPPQYQHRVLFWGVVGAAAMRFIFIFAGVRLLNRFEWLIYGFGIFLIFTGIKMALPKKNDVDPSKNIVVRLFRKYFPVSRRYSNGHFFITRKGRRIATPLFIVLLVIESTDLAFAVDSIPAVLAITKDPFIVFTSNIFAILGLRAIYFALNGVMTHLRYLGLGLSVILVFIGIKMMLPEDYHPDIGLSLGIIGGILSVTIIASLLNPRKSPEHTPVLPSKK